MLEVLVEFELTVGVEETVEEELLPEGEATASLTEVDVEVDGTESDEKEEVVDDEEVMLFFP